MVRGVQRGRGGRGAAVDTVERRLAAGASVDQTNENGSTSLKSAVLRGHAAVVELLAAGASVDQTDSQGTAALCAAVHYGHAAVVELLLAAGASVDQTNVNGDTELLSAAREGHAAVVERLLAAGAGVDHKGCHGNTALTYAAQKGHTDVVRLRAGRGDLSGEDGATPGGGAGRGGRGAVARIGICGAHADLRQSRRSMRDSKYHTQCSLQRAAPRSRPFKSVVREVPMWMQQWVTDEARGAASRTARLPRVGKVAALAAPMLWRLCGSGFGGGMGGSSPGDERCRGGSPSRWPLSLPHSASV